MKKLFASLLSLSLCFSLSAIKENVVNSKIKNVTVFLNGAQVHRKANLNLQPGLTDIVFDGVSSSLNVESIQVKGKGNFIIMDTKFRVKQPEYTTSKQNIPKSILAKMKVIKDSLELLNFDLEEIKYRKEVLELEKQMLIGNKSMKSDSLALLKDAMQFFREKYNDINATLIRTKKEENKLNKIITSLNKRLEDINSSNLRLYPVVPLKASNQVVITVSTAVASKGLMELNYLVNNASWSPKYDLRAKAINEPIQLTYKANIYQNTGENWEDVKIKLSTNNPNRSKTKPVLPIWYLNYYTNNYHGRKKSTIALSFSGGSRPESAMELDDQLSQLPPAQNTAFYASMNENLTNVEFDISIPYTIPSDGQHHMVAVKSDEIEADYKYYLVPKMDKDAFLLANARGWEKLNLLPAQANIYFEGTYIGKTMINPSVMGDTIPLALGRDERISIKSKLVKQEEKKQLVGNDITKEYTYELFVKNNRVDNVDLVIEDNIPVPYVGLEDVKVNLLKSAKAIHNKQTGLLEWKFNLAAKQSKKWQFVYTVQYDKNKPLALK